MKSKRAELKESVSVSVSYLNGKSCCGFIRHFNPKSVGKSEEYVHFRGSGLYGACTSMYKGETVLYRVLMDVV